eukprot:211643-Rhodomonas_salina.1
MPDAAPNELSVLVCLASVSGPQAPQGIIHPRPIIRPSLPVSPACPGGIVRLSHAAPFTGAVLYIVPSLSREEYEYPGMDRHFTHPQDQ